MDLEVSVEDRYYKGYPKCQLSQAYIQLSRGADGRFMERLQFDR